MGKKPKKVEHEKTNKKHLAKVEKTVQSMDRQFDKLKSAFKSRKHPLNEAQKGMILDHMEKSRQAFVDAISMTKKDELRFKF